MFFYLIVVLLSVLLAGLYRLSEHRVYDLERQDKSEKDGRYTRAEYMDLMHMLAETNMADPNGHHATLSYFENLQQEPTTIMEIGFGLGHFSILLATRFPNASIVGIDAHQLSVDSANTYLNSLPFPPSNVRFEGRRESQLDEDPKSVDIITTNLVNHHIFPDEQFVDFLRRVAVVGRQSFIFNDMHRSAKCILSTDASLLLLRQLGMKNLLYVAKYLPPFMADAVTRYKDILYDNRPGLEMFIDGGRLSVRRSFSIPEYEQLFAQAGYPPGALRCTQLDKWYETLESTCRVVCVADLSWSA